MRAIMTSVDYGDLLSITLPYNRHHFSDVCVVTTKEDKLTQEVAARNNCVAILTDAFTRNGARFNKWLALEEGLDWFLGKDRKLGIEVDPWLCIMDADTLWPKEIDIWPIDPLCRFTVGVDPRKNFLRGYLYAPLRRMFDSVEMSVIQYTGIPQEKDWGRFPIHRNVNEWAGYSQIFHLEDPALGNPPWHEVDWKHAGGADSFFQLKWPKERKVRPPFEVLHLGDAGKNWYGRATPYLDGTVPSDAKEKEALIDQIWRGRRGKPTETRFDAEKIELPSSSDQSKG